MAEPLHGTGSRAERLVLDLIFVLLCAFALVKAIQTTSDVQWPYDLDQFRDIGMAQAVLDHRYGGDHLYLGESIWYNPLTSLVVAACSVVSSAPPPLVVVCAGAYLNLLAPIAFYLLVACLFGRWVALAAAAAFLFGPIFGPIGVVPSWAAATYSPWIFSQNLAQGFFYLTLVVYCKASESKWWPWYLLVGILLGITFLGHTAPAVILGGVILIGCLLRSTSRGNRNLGAFFWITEMRGLLLIVVVAFIVSLPLTFSILFRYHLRILNPVPADWLYQPLKIDNLPTFVADNLNWFTAISLVGLIAMLRHRERPDRKIVLLTWLGLCCLELALSAARQTMPLHRHVMFVPAHHFFFYLRALEDILFAVGVIVAVQFFTSKVASKLFSPVAQGQVARVGFAAAITIFLAASAPTYLNRFDFTTARREALGLTRKAYIDAYHWILSHTKPVDVFLSLSGDLDLSIVQPADRKIVVTSQPEFSNPYVDWKSRFNAASEMAGKLASAEPDALATLIDHNVSYIITAPIDQFDSISFLSKEFAEDDVVIYSVRSESKR